jgi:RES domain-containing protein
MSRVDPHPAYRKLAAAARTMAELAAPWKGVACRALRTPYAAPGNILAGKWAALSGGRWNRLGVETVYFALDDQTALAEVASRERASGLDGVRTYDLTVAGCRVDLHRTISLADPRVPAAMDVRLDELLACDWKAEQRSGREAISQAVGRAIRAAGFEALFAPSAQRREGLCLAVFPDAMLAESRLEEPEIVRKRRSEA